MAKFKYYDGTNWVELSPATHTHGNITNAGKITTTAVTSASGIVVVDSNNLIQKVTDMPSFRTIIGAGTSNFTGYTTSNKLSTNCIQNDANWSSFSGYSSTNKLDGAYINNTQNWTSNTGTVTGSSLTADQIVLGNGSSAIKISTYKPSGSGTTWNSDSDVFIPTMKAIKNYVTGIGYTSNAGTVTSVRVQAGTGLSSSTSSAQSSTLNTTISIASGYKLPTTTEWGNKADASDLNYLTSAPTSANTSGKIKIVVLSSEPSTKYSGYIYIITN